MPSKSISLRLSVLVALALAAILLALAVPPIHQDPGYHAFSDARTILGVPHFWNVVSNAPFAFAGAFGLWVMARRPRFGAPFERWAWWVVFAGALLVCFGSGYYHWHPDNHTLFWDRLPMTLVFMALLCASITERIHAKSGALLLAPFLALGILSVEVWRRGELTGVGDLRFYVLVQFYPLLAIPLMMALFPPRYTRTRDIGWLVAWYAMAKVLEHIDGPVFQALGGTISGHSLKHVAAALGVFAIARMVARREPMA